MANWDFDALTDEQVEELRKRQNAITASLREEALQFLQESNPQAGEEDLPIQFVDINTAPEMERFIAAQAQRPRREESDEPDETVLLQTPDAMRAYLQAVFNKGRENYNELIEDLLSDTKVGQPVNDYDLTPAADSELIPADLSLPIIPEDLDPVWTAREAGQKQHRRGR